MQDDGRTWGDKPGAPPVTEVEDMECQMTATGGSIAHSKNPKKESFRVFDPSVRVED